MDTSSSSSSVARKQRTILSFFQKEKNDGILSSSLSTDTNNITASVTIAKTKQSADEETAIDQKAKQTGRKFLSEWKEQFTWIKYCDGLVFCDVCCDTINAKLSLSTDSHSNHAKEAFVINGYCNWSQAIRGFKSHEKSNFHKAAFDGLNQRNFSVKLTNLMSDQQMKEMQAARIALDKIFDTVLFIGTEGLPFRGHDDSKSKFRRILDLRSSDVPELKQWLNRDGLPMAEVRAAKYFTIIMDETSDISCSEQVSICFRYVDDDLNIHEQFMGFYETKDTTGEALYNIVRDVLTRFDLNVLNLRGQCYDGASNVRHGLSGLINKDEPRALYIHCIAHRLNLVVTDAMNSIIPVSNFLGIVKALINFIRDSPKRLGFFKDIQKNQENELPIRKIGILRFCQTRWCVRVKSLETILANYSSLLVFFSEIAEDKSSDSTAKANASGFYSKLETFDFFCILKIMISIFKKIETANTELQRQDLTINESHNKMNVLLEVLRTERKTNFASWADIIEEAKKLEIDSPSVPRVRKAPKRYDSESQPHQFQSADKYYEKLYDEVLDTVIQSLEDRFNSKETKILCAIENFLIKAPDSSVHLQLI